MENLLEVTAGITVGAQQNESHMSLLYPYKYLPPPLGNTRYMTQNFLQKFSRIEFSLSLSLSLSFFPRKPSQNFQPLFSFIKIKYIKIKIKTLLGKWLSCKGMGSLP